MGKESPRGAQPPLVDGSEHQRLAVAGHEGVPHLRLDGALHAPEVLVVVRGVEVENGKTLHAGGLGEGNALLPRGVPPADARAVLGLGEHAVVDEEIGALDEPGQSLGRPRGRVLDVADVADAAAAMVETKSGSAAGMVQRDRLHGEVAGKAERLSGAKADMLEPARQLVETDREEWGRVKALEHLAGGGPLEVAAGGAHHPAAAKGGLEERQAVHMVEVQMAEQD